MFDLGGGELLLILVAVLLLFGPKKLPDLAQGLGKGLRQFRKVQQDFTEQINTAIYDEQRKENTRKAPPAATNTIARNATSVSIPSGTPGPESESEEKIESEIKEAPTESEHRIGGSSTVEDSPLEDKETKQEKDTSNLSSP